MFYWFIFLYFYVLVFECDVFSMFSYQAESNISEKGYEKASILSSIGLSRLLMPILYSESCRYRSMLFFTFLMPVSQYLDRFMEVKTSGLLVMMSMISLSSFSPMLAYWVCVL